MLKLGDKNITKLYYGDRAIKKAYLRNKLVFQTGGRFVECIIFDGNSWIDTGLKAKNGLSVKLDFKLNQVSATQQLFGGRTATNKRFGVATVLSGTSNKCIYDLTVNSDNYGEHVECDLLRHTLKFDSNSLGASLSVDNNVIITTTDVNEQDVNLFLGANNWTSKIPSYMRVYSCEMYENDVLVRDYRPYVDENGTACFKDVVTGKLFYNQGTGTLEYTE